VALADRRFSGLRAALAAVLVRDNAPELRRARVARQLVRVSADPMLALSYLDRRFPARRGGRAHRRAVAILLALREAVNVGQRSASRARAQRVRFWEYRTNVRAAQACRVAAERSDDA
jgi:hypothetical protein